MWFYFSHAQRVFRATNLDTRVKDSTYVILYLHDFLCVLIFLIEKLNLKFDSNEMIFFLAA